MSRDAWDSLCFVADRSDSRFGRYVDSVRTREDLRRTPEGRAILLDRTPTFANGLSHERTSDISPFVAWDGEGITYEPGMPQSYVLFGDSQGFVTQAESLSTLDCLDTIIASELLNPYAIHVGFAFKYDAEMILRDLPLRSWWVLKRQGMVRYEGHTITYRPGRMFRVSRREGDKRITATIYDVWGFFQSSFVKALRTWLSDSELAEIERIESGKAARGSFTYDQIDGFIRPYWEAELRLLVVLMGELRERMLSVDLCPREWHGAGAVATAVYRTKRTRQYQCRTKLDWNIRDSDLTTELPEDVNNAARYAYAGGRFELFKLGHHPDTVYQYDINSAYPAAIQKLPSLAGAEWRREVFPRFDPKLFALWRIDYDSWRTSEMFRPGPLPFRARNGTVSFPARVSGWYWTPEAALIANSDIAIITEAWICDHEDVYPFEWVADLYAERKRRKMSGDPSEKAQKLALNSLYGKMAQRLGWKFDEPLPRFHQLEWAGWVTSYTRMQIFYAIQLAGDSIIATETDAIFTTKPIPELTVGSGLGEWELTEHAWITYLQSGCYWSDHGAKYRGFDAGSLNHDDAMQWLREGSFSNPIIGTTTRFIGSGTGLGSPLHRCWVTEARELRPGATGKRMHVAEVCPCCYSGEPPDRVMHPMVCTIPGGKSEMHNLPWRGDGVNLEWQELYEIEGWDAFG